MTWVALLCPECAAELPAMPQLRVHTCPSCNRSWTLWGEDGWRALPRFAVRPRDAHTVPGEAWRWWPIWEVGLEASALSGRGAELPPRLLLPAIGVSRLSLLLRSARNLSRARPEFETAEEAAALGPRERLSAEIGPEDAYVLAETLALRLVDAWPTDEQIDTIEIPLTRARLLDWPVVARAGEWVDLVAGLTLPAVPLPPSNAQIDGREAVPRVR